MFSSQFVLTQYSFLLWWNLKDPNLTHTHWNARKFNLTRDKDILQYTLVFFFLYLHIHLAELVVEHKQVKEADGTEIES